MRWYKTKEGQVLALALTLYVVGFGVLVATHWLVAVGVFFCLWANNLAR